MLTVAEGVRTLSLAFTALALQPSPLKGQSRTDEERAIDVDSNFSFDDGPAVQEVDL